MKKFVFAVGNPQTLFGFFDKQIETLKEKYDLSAITSYGDYYVTAKTKYKIPIYITNIERKINPLKDIISLFKLIIIIFQIKPDIIHANTPKVGLLSMISSFITRVHTRIYMCHGIRYESERGFKRKLLMFFEKVSCSLATTVVCVSPSVKEKLSNDKICDLNKLFVIRHGSVNGVDEKLFDYQIDEQQKNTILNKLSISPNSFIFCFVGRIVKDKGVNELCEAFNQLQEKYPYVHLLLLGSYETSVDPISQDAYNIIENNRNIHYIGWQNDIMPYLSISNILVLPSYREGLGNVLLEAGALSKPCLITNVTGCKDIITDEFNGKVIDSPLEKDKNEIISQLKNKMEDFLLSNKEYLSTMGNNSKQFVEQYFSRNDVINDSVAFYKSLDS